MAVAAVIALCAPTDSTAQSPRDASTFQFPAEFVSADPSTNTVILKARLAYDEAAAEVKQLTPGQSVHIVWSGYQTFADAIRTIRPAANAVTEDLVTPGVIVSPEVERQYVTIRVQAPAPEVATISSVKAGDWVTATALHRPSGAASAIASIRPYNDVNAE